MPQFTEREFQIWQESLSRSPGSDPDPQDEEDVAKLFHHGIYSEHGGPAAAVSSVRFAKNTGKCPCATWLTRPAGVWRCVSTVLHSCPDCSTVRAPGMQVAARTSIAVTTAVNPLPSPLQSTLLPATYCLYFQHIHQTLTRARPGGMRQHTTTRPSAA